jgi:aspartate aminotransferase
MTGWRIGYAGAPRDLIKAMTKLQSQSTSCASAIGQAAALAALTGPMTFLDEWRAQYTLRRDTVLARFNQMPGLRCTKPEGAFYLYPECADLIGKRTATGQVIDDDSALVLHLLDSQGVGVVQGTAFGLGPAFRVSFATSLANLNEACDRIGRALAALT